MKHGEKKRASPTRKLPPQIQAALDWDSPTFKLWDEIDPLSADAITRLVSNYDEQRGKWPSHLRPHVWKRLAIDALYIHHTADNKGERPPHDVVKLWCRLADLPDHEPFLWQFREGEQDGRGDPKYKLRFAAAILDVHYGIENQKLMSLRKFQKLLKAKTGHGPALKTLREWRATAEYWGMAVALIKLRSGVVN